MNTSVCEMKVKGLRVCVSGRGEASVLGAVLEKKRWAPNYSGPINVTVSKPYKGVCLTEMMSSMKPRGSTFICRNAERQTARLCALRRYDEVSRQRHSHSHLHVQGKPSWSSVFYQGQRGGVEGGRFHSCCEFGEEAEESVARQLLQRVSERQAALGGGGGGAGCRRARAKE